MNKKLNMLRGSLSDFCLGLIKFSLTLLFIGYSGFVSAQSEEDLKKQGEQLFEEEEYTQAYKIYSQLVSNKPTDPLYNYRLGVCMIYSEPNKKKPFSYLNKAFNNRADLPKDVAFFIGKAYHINYMFDEAIKFYNIFKKEAPASLQKKLQVDLEIQACNNGKRLLSNMTDLVVLTKKQLNEADYFRSYNMNEVGGKILVLPDKFKTPYDKKKNENTVMYLTKDGGRVYFSSYGNKNVNGKDIYYADRLPNGDFDKPHLVEGINTEYDEDYPFMNPNGKDLYFSSKGYNSMGGYDIFVSHYNENTKTWGPPKNLEFPINSPDNDYLYVTDSSGKIAFFSTGRYSPPNKIDVLKIKTERKPIDFIVMKASVSKETAKQSLKSVVSIKNATTGEDIGVFYADDSGNLNMTLPNGAKLIYTVETPNLNTQTQNINLPLAKVGKPFSQTITYVNGILKIVNNFDEPPSDDSYLAYMKLIEEKAKLDPNEGKNNLSSDTTGTVPLATNKGNQNAVNTNNPTVTKDNATEKQNETTGGTEVSKYEKYDYSSKDSKLIAQKDAEKANNESKQLLNDANDANELAKELITSSQEKNKKASDLESRISSAASDAEKTEISKEIESLKRGAANDKASADEMQLISNALKKDAENKAKEANINSQLFNELQKSEKSKTIDPNTNKNIKSLKEQLIAVSKEKNEASEIYKSINNAVDNKEKELETNSKELNVLNKDLTELDQEIKKTESELASAKKKQKPEIQNRLDDLNKEKSKLTEEISKSKSKEEKLSSELDNLNSQIALTEKIKNESIATNTNGNGTPINNETKVQDNQQESAKTLETKYSGKLNTTDQNNQSALTSAIDENKKYNSEIDKLIADNKKQINSTKDATLKKKLTTENNNLEAVKKQNNQTIANYNKRVEELNKQAVSKSNKEEQKNTLTPITDVKPEDISKELETLKSSLNQLDNQNFAFNNFTNGNSQNLKVQADAQINDAYAGQNKLKEQIDQSLKTIEASKSAGTTQSPDDLLKEVDNLYAKAGELRKDAETKNPDEKAKLLSEADDLENKADGKQIEASELSGTISNDKFSINNENINALIASGKALDTEVENAKRLMSEADQAMKQAKSIREEANSFNNTAAKIGNLGNAEEKEQIALNKQTEAVNLLEKSNSNIKLKTYEPKQSGTPTYNPEVVQAEIAKINTEIENVVKAKTTAYETLSKANDDEITNLQKDIDSKAAASNDQSVKDNLSKIKSIENEIQSIKANIDQSAKPEDKLTTYNSLVKKQNEAIVAYDNLNKDLQNQPVAVNENKNEGNNDQNNGKIVNKDTKGNDQQVTNENKDQNNQGGNENIVAKTTQTTSEGNKQAVTTNTTGTQENKNVTEKSGNETAKENVVSNETKTVAPEANKNNENFTVDIDMSNNKDTSLNQINSYFANNDFKLSNDNAESLKNLSIDNLKSLVHEFDSLDQEIAKVPLTSSGQSSLTNQEIQSKIDNLLGASDNLYNESGKLRAEANTKSGPEKEDLLKQADDLDRSAFDKKVEASLLTQQYNEANYNLNNNAINDMIAQLDEKNSPLVDGFRSRAIDLENKKRQAKNIREEANALTNNSAKLGAIGNAEEEEADVLLKQNQLIDELKKQAPGYTVKSPSYANIGEQRILPENIINKQKELQNKQAGELTKLTNAYNLEFETNKNSIPDNPPKATAKDYDKVFELNNQAKTLLVKSTQTNDPSEKIKLLSVAAKSSHAAAKTLNKLNEGKTPAIAKENEGDNNKNENPEIAKNTNKANKTNKGTKDNKGVNKTNEGTSGGNETSATKGNQGKVLASIEGLEVLNKDAYSDRNPIPVDAKMPDGLVFRVQIGAFKSKIPNNAFRGLTPINGETTPSGYTRYTAGNFNNIENASAVKSDLNKNGYPDAFIVAFLNGKRITINEALEMLKNEGKTVDLAKESSAGITSNVNPNNAATTEEQQVVVTKELEKTKNLLYTVQIGVYSRKISSERLRNLSPIYSEQLPNGLFRYTAGIYNGTDRLITDKNRVIDLGIKDAFVSAYLEGKRIPFNDAKAKKDADSSIIFEAENPIVFPSANQAPAPGESAAPTIPTSTVVPYKNNVTSKPAATPDNGVKETDEGVTFKVQIGAYSRQVPNDVAGVFDKISTWPVENKFINGLFLYNVGSFTEARFAKQLKEEMVALGITDAFVVVYKDGVKLFGSQAADYLNR